MRILQLLCLLTLLPAASHAAINASQTLVIQSGGTERARINTNGIETSRVSATYISATYIQVPTPTSNNQAATKAYVDTAVAASGSGRPTYMGVTGTSYNGALGGGSIVGVQKGNILCNAAFAGSRMLATSEIHRTDFTTPIASTAWIHCDIAGTNSAGRPICMTYPDISFTTAQNCSSSSGVLWYETASGEYGLSMSSTHTVAKAGCQTAIPIHCVKD